MSEGLLIAIIPSVITGVLTVVGVIISNKTNQAVTDTKIEELTYEVRKHNNFAERIPKLEADVESINEKINLLHK